MWEGLLIQGLKSLGGMVVGHFVRKGLKKVLKKPNHKRKLIPDIYGIDLLKVILKEHRIQSQEIIDIFGSEAKFNSILNDEQELTFSQIQKLSKLLLISPMAFYPQNNQFRPNYS